MTVDLDGGFSVFIVLLVIAIGLVALLFALVASLDLHDLRRRPEGLLSLSGMWLVVGGGLLAGFAYGVLIGQRGGGATWEWLGRGLIDGLVVANAGAFYLGVVQRRRKSRDEDDQPDKKR